jgi:hypothetical protein
MQELLHSNKIHVTSEELIELEQHLSGFDSNESFTTDDDDGCWCWC